MYIPYEAVECRCGQTANAVGGGHPWICEKCGACGSTLSTGDFYGYHERPDQGPTSEEIRKEYEEF